MELTATELETLRYPIGEHTFNGLMPQQWAQCLADIESLPERLGKEVSHLSAGQLDTPYRPGSWTIRQVVHHLGDSHMNGMIRCKLALTEPNPVIKPYDQSAWAGLSDVPDTPLQLGLDLVTAVHGRWIILLRALAAGDLQKTYRHPEYNKTFTVEEAVSQYAWHGNHHLAHITGVKKRNGWK